MNRDNSNNSSSSAIYDTAMRGTNGRRYKNLECMSLETGVPCEELADSVMRNGYVKHRGVLYRPEQRPAPVIVRKRGTRTIGSIRCLGIFNTLPDTFSRDLLEKSLIANGYSTPVSNIITQWEMGGLITKNRRYGATMFYKTDKYASSSTRPAVAAPTAMTAEDVVGAVKAAADAACEAVYGEADTGYCGSDAAGDALEDVKIAVGAAEVEPSDVFQDDGEIGEGEDAEYAEFQNYKNAQSQQFMTFDIKPREETLGDFRYAVALFSDAHIEETVDPDTVAGLNQYDIEIAKQRIARYFQNLALCLNEDRVEMLIFASLGDTISGFIHEELAQCNGMTPLEATYLAQSLIYSGLKFIRENTCVEEIKFVGISGNHSRTTKRIQHANGAKLSYEWLMYKNIERQCSEEGLDIEFMIPNAEIAIVNAPDGKRLLFCHGYQIKGSGNGTVCGIYPSLNRLAMKWSKTFSQDRIYLGHFHSITSIPGAVVNGSIIGYNSFSLTNGFPYEVPSQYYAVYDTEIGELLERKIYCR